MSDLCSPRRGLALLLLASLDACGQSGGKDSSAVTGSGSGASTDDSGDNLQSGGSDPTGGTDGGTSSGGRDSSSGSVNSGGNGHSGGSLSLGSGGEQPGSSYDFGEPITIGGRTILVGGAPLHLRGVCWNPVPKGGEHPSGIDFNGLASTDIPLMKAAGINVVRTYEPVLDLGVLDQLAAAEIYLIQSVFPYGDDPNVVIDRVQATQHHPAVLMWAIGNEWNYNGFYVDLPFSAAVDNIKQAVTLIRGLDETRPIATIYGELPDAELISDLEGIDVWGINAYRGLTFNGLIEDFAERSKKPMFLAEFGADAWDARDAGSYNPDAQAQATSVLIAELLDKSAALKPNGLTLGGTIFEWADEWWKAGDPLNHDTGGSAPGGGPHPDATFNEEWWGIVDIDRTPRPAYDALRDLYLN